MAQAKGKARKPDPLFNDKVSVNENGAIARGACQYWAGDGPGGIPGLDASYCRCPSCKGTWWVDLHAIDEIRKSAKRKRETDLVED